MTAPWWGREANPKAAARMVRDAQGQLQPELAEARRQTVEGEVRDRIGAYTPEWTRRQESDPGLILVRLFSEQAGPVLKRLNRLPEKMFVEYLRSAGVRPLGLRPASSLLQFEVAQGATRSVLVPKGFQVGARPAAWPCSGPPMRRAQADGHWRWPSRRWKGRASIA